MFANARTHFTRAGALLAMVVGLGGGAYGVMSASSSYSTAAPTAAAVVAPAAPPGATAQQP
jgi:hypothetical protein